MPESLIPPAPPSSKRRRLNDADIPLTAESYVMLEFINCVFKCNRNGEYALVVVPKHDQDELVDFSTKVAERLVMPPPHVVPPDAESIFWCDDKFGCAKSDTGLLFADASQLGHNQLKEFEELHRFEDRGCRKNPHKPVIAVFQDAETLQRSISQWPEPTRRRFNARPFVWPKLSRRVDDLPGIIEVIRRRMPCGQTARLSDATTIELMRNPGNNVRALRERIKGAYAAAARSSSDPVVMVNHLREHKRRRMDTPAFRN